MDLKVPLTNEAKEKALAFAAQQQMSTLEYERRAITGTLESSTIRVAIALLGLTKIEVGLEKQCYSLAFLRKKKHLFTYSFIYFVYTCVCVCVHTFEPACARACL